MNQMIASKSFVSSEGEEDQAASIGSGRTWLYTLLHLCRLYQSFHSPSHPAHLVHVYNPGERLHSTANAECVWFFVVCISGSCGLRKILVEFFIFPGKQVDCALT